MRKIVFWSINVIIAILLLVIIGYIVLLRLDSYTQHGQFIKVPDLRGFTPQEAEPFAMDKDLFITVIDSVYDNEAKAGTIIDQFPSPESKVKNSRTIQLTINANSPEKIIFPNLKNTAFRQTLQKLKNIGLTVGQIKYTPSNFKNLVLGFTYDDRPIEAGDLIQKGERVDILLGDGNSDDNQVFIPDLRGKKLEEAKMLILQSFLNVGEVVQDETIRSLQDKKEAFVYMQIPNLNEQPKTTQGSFISIYLTTASIKLVEQDTLTTELEEP